jgi:hypothetical protein
MSAEPVIPFPNPGPEVFSEVMLVGPDLARQWLEKNARNRPVRKGRVEGYAREMAAGRWKLTNDAVAFDAELNLVNGQHRLWACVKAGVPFRTLVLYGVDPSAYDAMDRGGRRTGGDDLAVRGESNWHTLEAARKLLWRYRQGKLGVGAGKPPAHELDEVLERNPSLRDAVSKSFRTRTLLTAALAAFLRFAFAEKSPADAERFFDDLQAGTGLEAGDPLLILRDQLMRIRAGKGRLPDVEVLALVIKAWNARRAGRKLRHLSWRSDGPAAESFPEIA